MPEEVLTLVKIPIAEIEKSVRAKHALPRVLTDVRLEGDALVLYFRDELKLTTEGASLSSFNVVQRRRRAHRKRNRMKTRGWEIVTRITNSKGQNCAIYKPFVDALRNSNLSVEEQKKIVAKILRSNRNKPSETSIQYFLENTLEYLQSTSLQMRSAPEEKVSE